MTYLILGIIRLYQKTLSLDHGFVRFLKPYGQCKFFPSCSEYAHQAISVHGVFKGSALGLKRLLRCVPWSQGGIDNVK